MKNLAEVTESEQLAFINSFDHVLSDLDGVIWLLYKPLPGASACINNLKTNGKTIHYVSNNSTVPWSIVRDRLLNCGIDAELKDVVIPIIAIVSYLKKIQFNKKLYVIGANAIKDVLQKEGFTIMQGPHKVEEKLSGLLSELCDDEDIGAVIVEFDLNLSYMQLQKAATYLARKDCLFIAGAADPRLPIGLPTPLIGPHYSLTPLIDFAGRQPYQIAKPSIHLNEYILETFQMPDKSRVLFIGDSISEDLNFATKCGYQKLLVLTGITKKEQLSNWEYPEEYKPQYYVESLNILNEIIQKCFPISKQ